MASHIARAHATHNRTHTYMHTCIGVRARAHTHAHTHTHTHTYTRLEYYTDSKFGASLYDNWIFDIPRVSHVSAWQM